METVRKSDMYAQVVIAVVSLLLLPTFFYFLCGEFVLGVWQVISALCNTFSMVNGPFRQRIIIYWILAVIAVLMTIFGTDTIMYIALAASWGIAIYYWITYRSFIKYLQHRNELSTVVRNK